MLRRCVLLLVAAMALKSAFGADPVACKTATPSLYLTSDQFSAANVAIIAQGDALTIKCEKSPSLPIPSIKWYRKLPGSADYEPNPVTAGSTLNMQVVKDGTWFKCEEDGQGHNKLNVTAQVIVAKSVDQIDRTTEDVKPKDVDIKCGAIPVDKKAFQWSLNGKVIVERADKYEMQKEDAAEADGKKKGVLTVTNMNARDAGCFVCRVWNSEADKANNADNNDAWAYCYKLKPVAITMDLKSKNVMEGDRIEIGCDVYGYPTPVVTWYKADDEDALKQKLPARTAIDKSFTDANPCVSIQANKNGHPNALLVIENAKYEDRAYYQCVATSGETEDLEAILLVRVKDKLAALWPFLGIVAEVIVLVVIILIFEQRQKAKERAEEADVDQKKPLASEESDVRQRAVKT